MRSWRTILAVLVMVELIGGVVAAGADRNHKVAPPAPPGVVQVNPNHVSAGGRTKLSFTVRAGNAGVSGGLADIAVPDGWSAPSTKPSDPGQVTSSDGRVILQGRSIRITGIHLPANGSLTVAYGGGAGGATEPTATGDYKFSVSVAASHGAWNRPVMQVPLVSVVPPVYACQTLNAPAGVGQGLQLESGALVPNLYNVSSSTGTLRQCSGPTGVSSSLSLGNLQPAGYGPAGYPEVAYGTNLDDQPFCGGCPVSPFPVRVSDLLTGTHDLRVSIRYSLGAPLPADLPRDFIYDVWLERGARPGSPPGEGDVELLIFLYEQGMASCDSTASTVPFTTGVIRNGDPVPSSWKVCQIPGGTKATPIAFFLQQPAQAESGELTLSLRDFIQGAGTYLNRSLVDHSAMGLEVGGEFNQCSANTGCLDPQTAWQWNLQDLMIMDRDRSIPVVFSEQRSAQG